MLVLSRKQDQDIVIGDNIRIRVLKIKGNTIRLGIEAPRDVKVMRGELPSEFTEKNAEATPSSADLAAGNPLADAEFTLVFRTDKAAKSAAADVIAFRQTNRDANPRTNSGIQQLEADDSHQRSPTSHDSTVRFGKSLPTGSSHNRLQELVKSLTRDI